MNHMLSLLLLAEATPPDPNIPAAAVVGIIGAITTLVVGIIGKLKLDQVKNESRDVTLKPPVPTVRTQEEPQWATDPDLKDHVKWTREEFKRVWGQFGTEREIHNKEISQIGKRIDEQAVATAEIKGTVSKIDDNVDKLLDLALNDRS